MKSQGLVDIIQENLGGSIEHHREQIEFFERRREIVRETDFSDAMFEIQINPRAELSRPSSPQSVVIKERGDFDELIQSAIAEYRQQNPNLSDAQLRDYSITATLIYGIDKTERIPLPSQCYSSHLNT